MIAISRQARDDCADGRAAPVEGGQRLGAGGGVGNLYYHHVLCRAHSALAYSLPERPHPYQPTTAHYLLSALHQCGWRSSRNKHSEIIS